MKNCRHGYCLKGQYDCPVAPHGFCLWQTSLLRLLLRGGRQEEISRTIAFYRGIYGGIVASSDVDYLCGCIAVDCSVYEKMGGLSVTGR